MLNRKIITVVFIAVIVFVSNVATAQNAEELAVKKVLAEQTAAWNKGDIEGYMTGYWNSDSLLFIGKSGPKYGYTATLENYKKSYPDTAAMGKLSMELLQIKRLSVQYFFVVGKWHLQRSIGNLDGSFTLLLKKVKKNWVIVADHSS
jgi:ketosteroid isomerase-like protein